MKICFVANNIGTTTGLGRMVESIASRLALRGHTIGFVVSEGESSYPLIKINFRFSSLRLFQTLNDLYRMRSFVKDYDVVICYDVQPAGILAHLATFGRSDLIVVHSLGTYSLFTKNRKLKNKLIEYVYKKSARVWIINEFVKRKIEHSSNSFKFIDNINFVNVGVDTELFRKQKGLELNPLGEYIISVGAIKPRKGQFDSIKAFCILKDKYPNLKYLLIGSINDSPVYYKHIENFIKENNLEERIIFLQNINDEQLINFYSSALFFVLTPISTESYIEGFGMVYIESALCGLTSIGTKDTGAEIAIVNGKTGLILEQGDVVSISNAMIQLLDNADYRSKLADQARALALTYDWKYVVDLYELELTRLLNNDSNI